MTKKRSWLLASYHIHDFGVKGLSELALAENQRIKILKQKSQHLHVEGLFYLQTCNRIEYLYCLDSEEIATKDLSELLPAMSPRIHTDLGEIIEHLLSVCLSKDSLVFGENQILGQFKRSYLEAKDSDLVGNHLNKILPWVLQEAKKIRSQLPFKHFPSSMSALAAKALQQRLEPEDAVLFIGAGETNELVAKYLSKKTFKNFYFLNRSLAKAENLAKNIAGQTTSWQTVTELKNIKAIVCATTAQEILVDAELLKVLRPEMVIDLSMPHNVCKDSCQNLDIAYFDISSFQNSLEKVKKECQSFLWELQKHIIDAKINILNHWQIHTHANSIKTFKLDQESYMERILSELEANQASPDLIANMTKELRKISHQQILDFRKSIQNEESY